MKPILTKSDYNTIHALLKNLPAHLRGKEVVQLQNEINSAEIINDSQISDDIIQINSLFEVVEITSGQKMNFQLVLPQFANLKQNRISLISPLGVALIGFRKGMTIEWMLPGGLKKLHINGVKNGREIADVSNTTEINQK
ncbi:MAG: GreA/GreB family elongation factor [Cyclobacteriaceae bacterium]|nr:GreA/GreB family elongation factor [Cyclobacteriaceae bacterium]